jgi:glucosylceramidase
MGGALSGLAWHCYLGSPDMMSGVHQAAPSLTQVVDECTTGGGNIFPTSETLISSFRNWASAVSLWNLALDPSGGPVESWAGCAGCTGVVTVNERDGGASLSPDYYELGQLSDFVQPGAVRVGTENFVSYGLSSAYQTTITAGLDDVAFENPNGSHVLMAYNNSTGPIPFAVEWRGHYLTDTIPAQATTTFTWGLGAARPTQ